MITLNNDDCEITLYVDDTYSLESTDNFHYDEVL